VSIHATEDIIKDKYILARINGTRKSLLKRNIGQLVPKVLPKEYSQFSVFVRRLD
jgi:hypothetical protein